MSPVTGTLAVASFLTSGSWPLLTHQHCEALLQHTASLASLSLEAPAYGRSMCQGRKPRSCLPPRSQKLFCNILQDLISPWQSVKAIEKAQENLCSNPLGFRVQPPRRCLWRPHPLCVLALYTCRIRRFKACVRCLSWHPPVNRQLVFYIESAAE